MDPRIQAEPRGQILVVGYHSSSSMNEFLRAYRIRIFEGIGHHHSLWEQWSKDSLLIVGWTRKLVCYLGRQTKAQYGRSVGQQHLLMISLFYMSCISTFWDIKGSGALASPQYDSSIRLANSHSQVWISGQRSNIEMMRKGQTFATFQPILNVKYCNQFLF